MINKVWGICRAACVLLFLALLLNNCSLSPEENPSGETSSPDTSWYVPDSSILAQIKGRIHTIGISEMKFHPSELMAKKGDTVIWINNDLVVHCVTEETSKAWTSAPIPAGASWKMVINQSTNYYCAIHVVMKGTITTE